MSGGFPGLGNAAHFHITVAIGKDRRELATAMIGHADPHAQQPAFPVRLIIILVSLPGMQDGVIVDELHIPFLKLHLEAELFPVGDLLKHVQRFPLSVAEGELLAIT